MTITHRQASINDLKEIIDLLAQDELGKDREQASSEIDQRYADAFHAIDKDPNQYLMVLCDNESIVGTCHLSLMPSLTFTGSTRMQIEAVRVLTSERGKGIGKQMIDFAIDWGKNHGASLFQLTTNKKRPDALKFYEQLGFKPTHEGMKLYLNEGNI